MIPHRPKKGEEEEKETAPFELLEPEPLPLAEARPAGLRQRRGPRRPLGRGGRILRAAAPTPVSVPLSLAVPVPLAVAAAPACCV